MSQCLVQATQHARETLEAVASQGKLGPAGLGAKVIYAQTDSIFASFPNATTEQAIQVSPSPLRADISPYTSLQARPCACSTWILSVTFCRWQTEQGKHSNDTTSQADH